MKKITGHAEFARSCGGPQYTPAQQVCFSVAFDGAEPTAFEGEQLELARSLFGDSRVPIPTGARGVFVLKKGARVGGSYAGGVEAVRRGLTVLWPTGAAGEELFALFVGPDVRLAEQPLRYALGAVKANPELARRLESESESESSFSLRRDDGRLVTFQALPATRGGSALRGRSLVFVEFTEFSFVRDAESVVNDVDLFNAVVPRIVPGGLIFIESTPWADTGLLYDLFQKNHGAPKTCVAAHAPTLLMRPDEVTRGIVERAREQNPENAAREFDAQWILAGTPLAVLKPEWLAKPFAPRPEGVVVQQCYPSWFYYDPSGGGEDADDRVCVEAHFEDWQVDDTAALPKAPDGSAWCTHQGSERMRKIVKPIPPPPWVKPNDPALLQGLGAYEEVTVLCRQTLKGNWFEIGNTKDEVGNRVHRMLIIDSIVCVPRALSMEAGLDYLIAKMREPRYRNFALDRPTTVVYDGFEEGLTSAKFRAAGFRPIVLRWTNKRKHAACIRMQNVHRDGLIHYGDPDPVTRRELIEYSQTHGSGGVITFGGRGRRDDHAACVVGVCMTLTELRVVEGDPWKELNARHEIGPTSDDDRGLRF